MIKLLVDTDIFCKLGVAGLLRDALNIFGATPQQCGRLRALPHMLKKGRLPKRYGMPVCETLRPIAESMSIIPTPSDMWLDKLIGVEAIDVGEAQLLAAAAESETILFTGDKRALQSLKSLTDFTQVLDGKIVVLEAALLTLCHKIGTEEVRRHIVPLAALDKVVEICFSKNNHDPPQGLQSYYGQLAEDLTPLILWEPRT